MKKTGRLRHCAGFIDRTVIGNTRPSGEMEQGVVHNGRERKHSLKYQILTSPDGLFLNYCGPIEGRRNDCTPYVRSGLESFYKRGYKWEKRVFFCMDIHGIIIDIFWSFSRKKAN